MPDDNSAPWPPAPPESKPVPVDNSRRGRMAGGISLSMASIGLIALIVALIDWFRVTPSGTEIDIGFNPLYSNFECVGFFLLSIWSASAVITGVIGSRTLLGKIGLLIGLAVFAIAAIAFLMSLASGTGFIGPAVL